MDANLLAQLKEIFISLRREMKDKFNRHVSFSDLLADRWDTAKFYGFGDKTSCYNNVLILGDVNVGSNTWIGPNVILDGSGGLEIGDFVSISANTQIYSHHTVEWSRTMGAAPVDRKPTKIGNGVYLGPNVVVQMGVTIGDRAVIGANSLVNKDVPADAKYYGTMIKK